MTQPPAVQIIHNDFGITIRVTIGIDLTGNNDLQLIFRDPSGTEYTRDKATHGVQAYGAETDGVIEWTTSADFFLDEPGEWKVHPRAIKTATWQYTGVPAARFNVESLFET